MKTGRYKITYIFCTIMINIGRLASYIGFSASIVAL